MVPGKVQVSPALFVQQFICKFYLCRSPIFCHIILNPCKINKASNIDMLYLSDFHPVHLQGSIYGQCSTGLLENNGFY